LTKAVPVYRDYDISIRNSSVFGGEFVYINPGSVKSDVLPQELILSGHPPVDLIYEASDLIRLLKKDAEELRKVVEEERLFENVSRAAKGFNEGARKFDEFIEELKGSKGTLGKLMNDPGAYDEAMEMFRSVKTSSEKLNSTLDEIRSEKGTFGKLLARDEAYNKLLKALDDFSVISSRIASSKGSFGKLLNDNGKLYDALFESITISKDLVAQLKQGDGTLGKLMTDKQLYDEMLETARQIKAVVESYREQAPMATFGSMALGAF
jgi:phospholipid/cholesterol/gamma-HCH transport system substrate-binding protein